jgi:hypothetical protein
MQPLAQRIGICILKDINKNALIWIKLAITKFNTQAGYPIGSLLRGYICFCASSMVMAYCVSACMFVDVQVKVLWSSHDCPPMNLPLTLLFSGAHAAQRNGRPV